jgi:VIT1/CCC1 family predicted Fe2+/Mn2+ transporter
LLAGIAGLLGGACSSGWLSVTNARELALSQLDRAMGAPEPDLRMQGAASAGHAASAPGVSFLLLAIGAFVPLLPFCLWPVAVQIAGRIALSVGALFAIGVAISRFKGCSALFSGIRQMTIGAAAAAVTYIAGPQLQCCRGRILTTDSRALWPLERWPHLGQIVRTVNPERLP